MADLKKNKDKKIYVLVVLIILITILIGNISSNHKKKHDSNLERTEEETEAYTQQNITLALQTMKERERMEYYFRIFLGYIEKGEYEKAYNLLYEDFKKTYFPNLEAFQNYIPTVFSEMTNIQHNNIERNGDLYVLWISVTDAIHGKKDQAKEMNIVIQEKDYNDFVLSFSVI